jgi:recombination protein RecT
MNQPLKRGAAPALVPTPTRAEVFIGEVLPPNRMETLVSTLPAHVKPERFERNLLVAVTQHPALLECDPAAVFNEVGKAAALGLYLDPQLGEAYLITGWDGRANRKVPQLRLGYRGLIKLARQSGQISRAYAHEVCEYDPVRVTLGTEKSLFHEPDFSKPRGKVLFYYAVAAYADGEVDFEPMAIEKIHAIRERSDGWRAFKAGKIKSTPWSTDEEEMAKKTVLRRLLKRLPQSPELAEALRIEDAEFSEADTAPRLSVVQRLQHKRDNQQRDGFDPRRIAAELDQDEPIDGEFSDATDEPDRPGGGAPDATDDFPGDRPSTAFDVRAWASETSRGLDDFPTLEALNAFTDDPENIARFETLMAEAPALAKSLEAAITGRRKALTDRARG